MPASFISVTLTPVLAAASGAFLLTIPVVVSALRQPLKRRYHYFFIASLVCFGLGFEGFNISANLTPDPSTYLFMVSRFFYPPKNLGVAFLYGFAAYFAGPRLTALRKGLLVAAFADFFAWLSIQAVDPYSLAGPPVFATPTGYLATAGNLRQYFQPFGVEWPVALFGVLAVAELLLVYRSQANPVTRRQIQFLSSGTVLIVIAMAYGATIVRTLHVAGLQSVILAAGIFVLWVGIRRHGFYKVVPVAETAAFGREVPLPLMEAHSYLTGDTTDAFRAFSDLVKSGREGLCITRTFPETVRETYALQTTPIRWLAEERRDDAIPPEDLIGLSLTVKDFLGRAQRPVVIIQGVEYLSNINGFAPVLRLLNGLNEVSAQHNGIMIIPVLPNSLEKQEEALLTAETSPLPAKT